ncbi:hypothetical protein ACIRPH_19465 [Nocardiopsis sp. NPDC101807]|uniref:hypothetical protein n=1 Tax=Nocardiopsis sp. NPDC101807 TaxID=3364339 RepID=UPI0037FD60FB
MHHPPRPPPSAQPDRVPPRTAGSYARAYRRRRVTGLVLFGAALAVMAGNFAVMAVAAEAERPFGLLGGVAWARSVQAWTDTVGVLALVAVPALFLAALLCAPTHWPPPDRVPPRTTPEGLRAARALVRHRLIGSDARVNHVARSLAEAVLVNPSHLSGLSPWFRAGLYVVIGACHALMLAGGLYVIVRSLLRGDLNGLATGVHTVLMFIGLLCLLPLASARRARAGRYLALHDAARRRAGRHG